MIRLILVRHGTTSAIEQRRLQGSSDSPLSARGREEARLAAVALQNSPIDHAFSSPMGRARETADIICGYLGLGYQIVDELREMNFGFFEGREYFDAPDKDSPFFERLGLLGRIMIAQVTGEPLFKVSHRARQSWQIINERAENGMILVISHGALINYLIQFLLPRETFKKIKPVHSNPCSITELEVIKPGNSVLIRLNDIRHLTRSMKID